MTNTRSELYEKHPDWIVQAPRREPVTGRGGTQLVLDLSNPDVQDYVFGVVDSLMTKYPGIDYIKWDANMGIQNHGSHYLEGNRQSHLYIAYHRGFEAVCRRIREKYPDLTLQACAQGGGRANYGVCLLRRVLGERQHRCLATHLYAVGDIVFLSGHGHG